MTQQRRRDRLGIHSIGEFRMTVPSLDDANRFYSAFGLDVQPDGDTGSDPHLRLAARGAGCARARARSSNGSRCMPSRTTALRARTGGRRRADRSARGRRCFRLLDPQSGRPAVADPRRRENHRTRLPMRTSAAGRHALRAVPAQHAARRALAAVAHRTSPPRACPRRSTSASACWACVRRSRTAWYSSMRHGGDHHLLAFAASPRRPCTT